MQVYCGFQKSSLTPEMDLSSWTHSGRKASFKTFIKEKRQQNTSSTNLDCGVQEKAIIVSLLHCTDLLQSEHQTSLALLFCHVLKRASALIEPAAASRQLISLAAGLVPTGLLLLLLLLSSCGARSSSLRLLPAPQSHPDTTQSGAGKHFLLWLQLIRVRNNSGAANNTLWIEACFDDVNKMSH